MWLGLNTFRTNVLGTVNLLDGIREAGGVKSLVYASTFEVYGPPESIPIRENHPTRPVSMLGASKLIGEKYVQLFGANRAISWWVLRMPAVYGPGDRSNRAMGNFIRAAAEQRDLIVYGKGENRIDLLYVDDAIDAIELCLRKTERCVLNLGTGKGHSMLEIAETVRDAAGGRIGITHGNRTKRMVDCPLSTERIQSVLGWMPKTPLRVGVGSQLDLARR